MRDVQSRRGAVLRGQLRVEIDCPDIRSPWGNWQWFGGKKFRYKACGCMQVDSGSIRFSEHPCGDKKRHL